MEAMQSATMASAGAATPAPAPAPAPVTVQTVQASSPVSSYSSGGIIDKLKQLNWVEVGFGVLGSAALYYTIYYYKYNMMMKKTTISELMNRMDDLEIRLSDMEKDGSKSSTQVAGGFFV